MNAEFVSFMPGRPRAAEDPLLAALLFLGRRFGRPIHAEQITRGLPLERGRLRLEDFVEAAARASMAAHAAELDEASLAPLALPAIALTNDGDAIVVLERRGTQVCLAFPGSDEEVSWTSVKALLAECSGTGFFVRSLLYFDDRSLLYEQKDHRDWFWSAIKANAWIYGVAVLASLAINLAAALSTLYIMAVYDRVIPNRSMDTLTVLTLGVTVLYLLDLVLKSLRGYLMDAASRRFDVTVGERVFAKMLSLPPASRPASAGTLANTVREFDSLRDFFTSATLTVLGDVPFLVFYVTIIAWFAGVVAWVPIFAIPLVLGVAALFLVPVGRLTDEGYRESAQRNALLYEVVSGVDTLRGIGATGWARRRWSELIVRNAETQNKSRELAHLSSNITGFIQAMVSVGVVVAASLLVSQGKLSTGAMVACTLLAGRAIAPLTSLAGLIGRFHTTRAALASLDKLMKAPDEDAAEIGRLHLAHIKGSVGFHNLSFKYPELKPGTNADLVLEGVEISISAGEHVAIIGRVGSGKSSLLALVVDLFGPARGHVTVDDIDVRQITVADLRANVGYVPQDPMLFHGTVRENITMGAVGASDEQVMAAARIACLDELLAYTSDGLNMQVGEGGRRLSGGMRQAVTLARAVVSSPPILLLDEPSSAMDHSTERLFVERLKESRQGKTTIVVTHRPAMLALVDRVIVIERGRVVADGPKDAVLASLVRREEP